MKLIRTTLPRQLPALHPLPVAIPKDNNDRQMTGTDSQVTFLADPSTSTIVNDPSGWDESWFANYE